MKTGMKSMKQFSQGKPMKLTNPTGNNEAVQPGETNEINEFFRNEING